MKKIAALAAAVALSLLTACGGSTGSATASDDHNDADIAFVREMIPHHAQAVMMSEMASSADTTTGVEDLAGRIEDAQGTEIDLMSDWLDEWGAGPGHSMGDGQMMEGDGMMSGSQMMELRSLRGDAFAAQWLALMIEHHEGAITMAQQILTDGKSPDVKELAGAIITSQTEEITQMKEMR